MDRPLSPDSINHQRKRLWGKVIFSVAVIVALIYSIHWFFTPSIKRTDIRTAVVKKGTINATVNASGLVVPMIEETISSEISSQVSKVYARPGQWLTKGDTILQLNTQSVLLSIDKLSEQIALKDSHIDAKKLNLKKSINDIESSHALLSVDLESRVARASRLEHLTKTGASSQQNLLEAKLNIKRTKIEMKQLLQAIKDLTSTTEADIRGLKLEKSLLQKSLSEQQRLLKLAEVKASRSGVLSWLKHDEGSSVSLREPIAKIADTSQLRVEATLSDFYAPSLVTGMRAEIIHNQEKLFGQLETLAPTIENGVMKVLIALDNPSNKQLQHNIRVDVGLVTNTVTDAHILPIGPYVEGYGVRQVFIIHGNKAIRKEVEIGLSSANYYQIISGLEQGEEVIISNMSDYLHLKEIIVN